ncbi:MAG TPA: hypothetical protein VFS83_15480, partial [Ktedonobacterales bacterium]|nr:hypothetical protein [Ktedonobacterales bacterium]
PAATIQQAEAALGQAEKTQDSNQALDIVKQARDALQGAWAGVTATETIRARNADAARVVVVQAQAQLAVAQSLLNRQQQAGWDAAREALLGQLHLVARAIETADSRRQTDPQLALEEAKQAQAQLDTFMGSVYQSSVPAAGGVASASILGRLGALKNMLNEAYQVAALANDSGVLDGLMRRVDMLTEAANRVTDTTLAPLTEETERLKQEVFTFVNAHQQKATATAISETLAELRFHNRPGSAEAPEVREIVPGLYQVVGVREDAKDGGGRDDKRVLFTLSDDGKVTYDFSGYVGNTCLADAEAIFTALRRKSIVIADADWVHHQNLAFLSNTQLMSAPSPTFDVNKRQTELIARVVRALAQMGFPSENTEITATDGVVQIDARSGALGYYHVAIEPEGDMRTAKNNQNVSGDASDAVAQVARMADLPAPTNAGDETEDADSEDPYIQSRISQQQ